MCCITGPNGIGKTTLIRCCCGVNDFNEGDICIGGLSIKDNHIGYKKRLAYIPEEPDIYGYMTGIDFLNYIADVYKITSNDRQYEYEKYCGRLSIEKYLKKMISTYSHGTRQKLMILAALLHKPQIIFMDEPLVGLDEETVHELKMILREYCDCGGTILCSTHLYDKFVDICDRKVMMNEKSI